MNELAIRRPVGALRQLSGLVLPEVRDGDVVELAIRTENRDIAVRDMAAYLELTDHIYGRLQQDGFRSYAMRRRDQLRFKEIRPGSLEMLIQAALHGVSPLLIVWLCLKCLPSAANSLANAFNSYEQGVLARENRKRIRREMEKDEALAQVSRERKAELAALVEALFERERALLGRASRFAEHDVIEVNIRIKR